jgi:hypothetical protein
MTQDITQEMTTEVTPKVTLKNRVEDATSRMGVVGELLRFLWARKLWWLIPMIIALLAFGLFFLLASSSVLSPFIYTLF